MAARARLTVERLADEQVARLTAYRAKWRRIALDVEPCDRKAAGHWLGEAFRRAGLKPPESVLWEASPAAALRTYRRIALIGEEAAVRDDDPDRLVVEQVVDRQRAYVRQEIVRRTRIDLWSQVWTQAGLEVGKHLGRQFVQGMKSQGKLFAHGQHEADWLGPYDFFWRELGLARGAHLEPLIELAQCCGWWLAHREGTRVCAVIAAEKPEVIRLVEGRLHCEDGPALGFRDGTEFFFLRGVRVDRRIVETPAGEMPLSWWLDEPVSTRRQVIEAKIGAGRIAGELGSQEVHWDVVRINGQEHVYRLLQLRVPGRGVRRALCMVNPSTGEEHTEWIPREVENVQEALAWRNGSDLLPKVLT